MDRLYGLWASALDGSVLVAFRHIKVDPVASIRAYRFPLRRDGVWVSVCCTSLDQVDPGFFIL